MNDVSEPKRLREMIRILERKLGILSESELACCGITMAQCHALVEIGRARSISLNELAQLLDLKNSTMSRTVNNLVTDGLAIRDIDPQDRRYVTISLTESGVKIFKGIEEGMNMYFKKIYDFIPADKQKQVIESIEILIEAVSKNECCQ
ncbi:MarR family winged helix-turn-helix transcriptional regulator [Clostridium sp. HV4-5-A1G]|jgi:DNA-binding MarR family transcriptional regulator|uniref:MarR family winged helix-turn-helix transcriptional regulator n=1 Tax=Clostridium sp. HV4-5-A1G TaxID=2004595 RepID=UPI00123A3026|nr:MarR family transcriptional regulator [Clostridium sp. HV4-5-A1G]KAA8674648.1 MarR family transcriptional regulator [Clostridium sp. HV4-5-A1G]CAB1246093.1 MarR family transcriptional regulator [Clostridiaceae bacterium BL-3]